MTHHCVRTAYSSAMLQGTPDAAESRLHHLRFHCACYRQLLNLPVVWQAEEILMSDKHKHDHTADVELTRAVVLLTMSSVDHS